ncbi:uncharacterized protein LOC143468976 isoform X1 [Clavelina lepadiformis]|uniref:uncharacterized protein LOC143468976 isoform X1 n=1 Tax=Clavelina lepadiformis TaxID=159417 RepID=UPI0040417F31
MKRPAKYVFLGVYFITTCFPGLTISQKGLYELYWEVKDLQTTLHWKSDLGKYEQSEYQIQKCSDHKDRCYENECFKLEQDGVSVTCLLNIPPDFCGKFKVRALYSSGMGSCNNKCTSCHCTNYTDTSFFCVKLENESSQPKISTMNVEAHSMNISLGVPSEKVRGYFDKFIFKISVANLKGYSQETCDSRSPPENIPTVATYQTKLIANTEARSDTANFHIKDLLPDIEYCVFGFYRIEDNIFHPKSNIGYLRVKTKNVPDETDQIQNLVIIGTVCSLLIILLITAVMFTCLKYKPLNPSIKISVMEWDSEEQDRFGPSNIERPDEVEKAADVPVHLPVTEIDHTINEDGRISAPQHRVEFLSFLNSEYFMLNRNQVLSQSSTVEESGSEFTTSDNDVMQNNTSEQLQTHYVRKVTYFDSESTDTSILFTPANGNYLDKQSRITDTDESGPSCQFNQATPGLYLSKTNTTAETYGSGPSRVLCHPTHRINNNV